MAFSYPTMVYMKAIAFALLYRWRNRQRQISCIASDERESFSHKTASTLLELPRISTRNGCATSFCKSLWRTPRRAFSDLLHQAELLHHTHCIIVCYYLGKLSILDSEELAYA